MKHLNPLLTLLFVAAIAVSSADENLAGGQEGRGMAGACGGKGGGRAKAIAPRVV